MRLRIALAVDDALPAVLGVLGARAAAEPEPTTGLVELADETGALLADPWDVPPLVERGVTEAGIVAKHVVAECRPDVYEVVDLRVGRERVAVATLADARSTPSRRRPRIATTHPRLCRSFFAARGVQVETLALRRAAEAAVLAGAADAAVLALSSDKARTDGGLVAGDTIMASSARLIVNRSARVVRAAELGALVDRLRLAVREADPEAGEAEGADEGDEIPPHLSADDVDDDLAGGE